MTQIFGIHKINGLPDTPLTIDQYNTQLIENLSDCTSQIDTQSTSSVYIASDPVGAKIFIDDIEQIGFKTPAMITDMPPGHHNFKLTHHDHVDIESSMPIDPGRTYNIFLTMGKSTSVTTSTGSSDLIILLAIGLIGYLLIKK